MQRTTIPAALLLALAALPTAAVAAPAVDGEPGFVVDYMSSFMTSCVKKVHADPPVPSIACACLAALTADRVTREELIASKGDGERLATMHPEIRGFVGLCATAARQAR